MSSFDRPPQKVDIVSDLTYWVFVIGGLVALPVYWLLPVGQWLIGSAYEGVGWGGVGLHHDPKQAAVWYEKALEPRALVLSPQLASPAYRLGKMYQEGRGVSKDLERARTLLKQAAERGHAGAQNDLYVMLEQGGRPEDWPEALGWLTLAAKADVPSAMCNLGALHSRGAPGVLHDAVEARSMFELAHKEDPEHCGYNLAFALETGLGGPMDLARAHDLYLSVAQSGDKSAMRQLGNMLIEGRGAAKNVEEGKNWLRRGEWFVALADHGDNEARFLVARSWYTAGFGTQPSETIARAVQYLKPSAEAGHLGAMLLLAEFHELGIGMASDMSLAETWYDRASAAGEADATVWLVNRVPDSAALRGRLPEFLRLLEQAGKNGHARAQLKLSSMYLQGLGVPLDKVQAYVWLSLAAAMSPTNAEAEKERELLAKQLSKDQLIEAQMRGRALRAAIPGFERAPER